jgi:hypothetical protein
MHTNAILYFLSILHLGKLKFLNINKYSMETKIKEINDKAIYIIRVHLMLSVESYLDLNKQSIFTMNIIARP